MFEDLTHQCKQANYLPACLLQDGALIKEFEAGMFSRLIEALVQKDFLKCAARYRFTQESADKEWQRVVFFP